VQRRRRCPALERQDVDARHGLRLHHGLNLVSNFTYFLEDPDNGDQREQEDRRTVWGGRLTSRRMGQAFGRHTEHAIGVQVRHDAIGNTALYRTVLARRVGTIREDSVSQTSVGVFGQSEIEWSPVLRTTLGLRGEVYRFGVDSGNPLNSGRQRNGIVSPKFTAVLGPWNSTEVYVNAGLGYHSNDARGATSTVDPSTGEPVGRVTPLVRARGAEPGLRTVRIRGLQTTLRCGIWASTPSSCSLATRGLPRRAVRAGGLVWSGPIMRA
jgi:outer membrane receptor protein involved in Fe transport